MNSRTGLVTLMLALLVCMAPGLAFAQGNGSNEVAPDSAYGAKQSALSGLAASSLQALSSSIVLVDGVANDCDATIESGQSIQATFTVQKNCYGYLMVDYSGGHRYVAQQIGCFAGRNHPKLPATSVQPGAEQDKHAWSNPSFARHLSA